jgi:hypothetical protein
METEDDKIFFRNEGTWLRQFLIVKDKRLRIKIFKIEQINDNRKCKQERNQLTRFS